MTEKETEQLTLPTTTESSEPHLELAPANTGILTPSVSGNVSDIYWLSENIDKLVEAHNKINNAILRLAKPGDWATFSSESDAMGTAELGFAGAFRISKTIGISFVNPTVIKVTGEDANGKWFRFESEVTCIFKGNSVRAWGRAGSRDKFFGFANDKWKPVEDINEGNIKMAAVRGAMKEGVKVLLGLHHFPMDDLKKAGIIVSTTRGHSFKSNPKPVTEGDLDFRKTLKGMLMQIHGEDQKKVADTLETMTTFTSKDGETVPGKRMVDYLSGTRLQIAHGKAKEMFQKKFGKEYAGE